MIPSTSSADLQQQMREVRQNLGFHSEAMVKQARANLDWRNYVSNHPWISLGAAAAAGYLLVPRRHRCTSVDATSLNRTVDKAIRDAHQAAAPAAPGPKAPGLVSGLISSAVALLVREGLNLASEFVRESIKPPHVSVDPPPPARQV